MRNTRAITIFCCLLLGLCPSLLAKDSIIQNLQFKQISSLNGLPCDEGQVVHQDREGYLWIGSRLGLFQYDGYQTKAFKNNQQRPDLLTSNNITCLCDDRDARLWIGTVHGLNRLDRRTGKVHHYHLSEFDNSDVMTSILYTSQGELWVGTDGGLYRYEAEKDSFQLYCNRLGNTIIPHCSVKSLFEDHKGYVWIGTWDRGLFRYDPHEQQFYEMPKFNDVNSAHVVYEDSRNRLWIGTWGKGLYLLENPYATHTALVFRNYYSYGKSNEILDNYVYSLREDPATGTLWVGTRHGLSILPLEAGKEGFTNYPGSTKPEVDYMSRGVSSLIHDQSGRIWMSTLGSGIVSTSTRPRYFSNYSLVPAAPSVQLDAIRCVLPDKEGNIWLGMAENGLACLNLQSHKIIPWQELPMSRVLPKLGQVNALFFDEAGNFYIATTNQGYYRVSPEGKVDAFTVNSTGWLRDQCVYSFYEDMDGRLLVGTWMGLSVLDTKGNGSWINLVGQSDMGLARVRHIMQTREGDYWLTTSNGGILRLEGNLDNPHDMQLHRYEQLATGNFVLQQAVKTLQDVRGRIWACSQEVGLLLYNPVKDAFESVNRRYAIPGDNVSSMEEDFDGNFWLSTNYGLIRLAVSADGQTADLRIFSTLDGLKSNYFGSAISCRSKSGMLCFGNWNGITTFDDTSQMNETSGARVRVTDIKIGGHSLEELSEEVRKDVSELLPPYATKITLSPSPEQSNLTLEFSTLLFDNPQESRFAYQLEGYDADWIYTDAGVHAANYSNLPAGTYTFALKATNSKGVWSDCTRTLSVVVLPPLWQRWWAYLLYAVLFAVVAYIVYAYARRRGEQERELHLAHLESEKIEELNHKKLQFFTNITHDLMTPLTIISATVGELMQSVPQGNSYYAIIQNNINRLMRLLQQILEFRKAETGNLKLRVAKSDLADFCRREVESIQPLMKNKKLHLSLICNPENIVCYFDTDKIDKILYNLLSNSAKYNHEMGFVQLTLTYGDDTDHVRFTVKDNGQGISPDRQKTLFQRFYEGDYRKFNTYGTGIGLSLTKDLVELHQGTIKVDSTPGEGTTFTVTIPVDRSFFKEEEIDDTPSVLLPRREKPVDAEEANVPVEDEQRSTLLLVEDNEELLQLMTRLLKRDYNVLTAMNGKEALTILDNEEVDLIVSDIMMPEMDGIELTRTLKGEIETSHIPVILLTAKREEQDRAEAYEVGADAYITKPFSLSVLHARIRNLLKRRERAVRDFKNKLVLELNDFEFTSIDEDFMQRSVKCVQQHLSDPDFDQQTFSDEMGTSKSTLYKKLKSLTGMNTSAFIRNIRLKAACEMIEKSPTMRISDLAYAVGYNDPKYFSSCFKKEFGMLPSEYMDRFLPEGQQPMES